MFRKVQVENILLEDVENIEYVFERRKGESVQIGTIEKFNEGEIK